MSVIKLVNKLRERKAEGKFADASVENVWGEFLAPVFDLLGWNDSRLTVLNTVDPFLELGGVARIALMCGKARSARARARAEIFIELSPDANLSVITNFDEWEILFKRETIAEFRAEEFASADGCAESETWQKIVRLIGHQAIEDSSYLRLANQLYRQTVDEAEVEVYVRELNDLRKSIGDALITNPRELSPINRNTPARTAYRIIGISGNKANRERDEAALNQIIQRLIDRFIIFRFAEDNQILASHNPKPLSDLYYRRLLGKPQDALAKQDAVWRLIAGREDAGSAGLFGDFARVYRGGVFEPLNRAGRDCVNDLPLNDKLVCRIIGQMIKRPFKKKLARLLGYIYEKYIGQRLYIIADPAVAERAGGTVSSKAIQAHALREPLKDEGSLFVRLAKTPEKKNQAIYYTPEDVTRYICRQTVSALLDNLYAEVEQARSLAGAKGAQRLLAVFEQSRNLTVLDPSCGSGAFLIEALGLLREFYRALAKSMAARICVNHLEEPEAEIRRHALKAGLQELGEALVALKAPGVFALNWNIYGVDIDPRAVEICSVSLMIQVIEELVRPDAGEAVRLPSIMGENIKCGNSVLSDLPAEGWRDLFAGKEKEVADLAALRKEAKKAFDDGARAALYRQVKERTASLSESLPAIIDRKYRPMNWPLEFPEVFFGPQQGFAVVIGNPPYADIEGQFPPDIARHRYKTTGSGDLYTLMVENIIHLSSPASGYGGMIVPISLTFSRDMRTLRNEILKSARAWNISSYDRIPDALFGPNVRTRNSIAIMSPSTGGRTDVLSSPMMRWFKSERPQLFERLHFHRCMNLHNACGFPKLGSELQAFALERMFASGEKLGKIILRRGDTANVVYYKDNAYNWLTITRSLPPAFGLNGKPAPQTKYGMCYADSSDACYQIIAACSGLLLYWFWLVYGDGFDVTRTILEEFPVSPLALSKRAQKKLIKLGRDIQNEMQRYIQYKWNAGKRVGNYNLRQCRPLTDQVDELIVDEMGLGRDFLSDVREFCAATVRTELNAWGDNQD